MNKQIRIKVKSDGTIAGTTVHAIGLGGEEKELLNVVRVELLLDCATQKTTANISMIADEIEVLGKFVVHDAVIEKKSEDYEPILTPCGFF